MRIAVTGMGAVTPLGNTVAAFWEGLLTGHAGVGPITRFDAADQSVRIAAEVKGFEPSKREARHTERFVQLALAAAREAFLSYDGPREQVGVLIGCGIGGLATVEEQHQRLLTKGPQRVSPHLVPMLIPNMAAGRVAIELRLGGPNFCPVTACASGAHAIGEACRILERGEADAVLAGGTESAITPLAVAGFAASRALSTRNAEPHRASRPFDRDRDGFVLGEGAGVLLLEPLDAALARGAVIHGEVLGYGATADAHHITAPHPDGDGILRAMRLALVDAGLEPDAIDHVNAHATGTLLGDAVEARALQTLFAHRPPVSAIKSMTGHLLAGSGAIEAIACLKALQEGVVPPTLNLDAPAFDLNLSPKPLRAPLRTALSNALGFGGHNAVLVFGRHDG